MGEEGLMGLVGDYKGIVSKGMCVLVNKGVKE